MSIYDKAPLPKVIPSRAVPPPAVPSAPLPFKAIILTTLCGGLVSAFAALFLGRKDWALGATVGAILASVGLLGLKSALRRMLTPGSAGTKGMFMVQSYIRWFLALVVMFFLLKVSPACLIGALLSYLWFLGVLAVFGLKSVSDGTRS
jgi:Ca2+/Na+ antiporter